MSPIVFIMLHLIFYYRPRRELNPVLMCDRHPYWAGILRRHFSLSSYRINYYQCCYQSSKIYDSHIFSHLNYSHILSSYLYYIFILYIFISRTGEQSSTVLMKLAVSKYLYSSQPILLINIININ